MCDKVIRGESSPVAILTQLGFVLNSRVENEGNQSKKHVIVIHSHVMRLQYESKLELIWKNFGEMKKMLLKSLKQI